MAIYPIPADREEWLKLRRNYVGASEIAALLGAENQAGFQTSPFALHHIHAGHIEPQDKSDIRTRGGLALEDGVAKVTADDAGWTLMPGVFAVDDAIGIEIDGVFKGFCATLDRVVLPSAEDEAAGFSGPGAFECKHIEFDQSHHWIGGEPPIYYLIQLQAQLACSGYQWGAIGAKLGSRWFRRNYMRHEETIAMLRDAVSRHWEAVLFDDPPPTDHFASTAYALKQLFPAPKPETVLDMRDNNELPMLCIEDKRLQAQAAEIKKRRDEIDSRLREILGPNEKALLAEGISIKRTIGKCKEPRPAKPGEIIPGRKGNDTVYINVPDDVLRPINGVTA